MKVALVQKPKPDRTGEQPVYVRVSHAGREALVSLGLSILPREWNQRRGEVRGTNRDAAQLNALMQQRLADAQAAAHAALLEGGRGVTIREVKAAVVSVLHPEHEDEAPPPPIIPWMRAEVRRAYRAQGRESTALAYGSVLTNLEDYVRSRGKRPQEMGADALTLPFLTGHRDWLASPEGKGHATNYVHKQVTSLRALLRRAVRAEVPGATSALGAAQMVEVRKEQVERARIGIDQAREYYEMDLEGTAAKVRDWWCFSFFAGGVRLSDVCRLRWADVKRDEDGEPVMYGIRQQKTKRRVSLPLVPEAAAIVKRWEGRTLDVPEARRSPYVFGLLEEADEADPARLRKAIDRRGAVARKYLKKIAEAEGWPPIGFHSARHSIADHMRKSGASVYDIRDVLGQTRISTTEAYLAGFDEVTAGAALRASLRSDDESGDHD